MAKKKNHKKKHSSKSAYDAKKKNLKTLSSKAEAKAATKPDAEKEEAIGIPETEGDKVCTPMCEEGEIITEGAAEKQETEEAAKVPPMPSAPDVSIPYDPDFTEEDFSMSVKELDTKDIKVSEEAEGKKKKKKKKKLSKTENIIYFSILGICAACAVYCLFMLGENIWGKIRGQQIYEDVQFHGFTLEELEGDDNNLQSITSDIPLLNLFERLESGASAQIPESTGKYESQLAQMKASLSALKAKNDDIYGWIYIEGTSINHPVVRGEDNDYYLDHAYTGNEYLTIGSIFADCTTKDLITDNFNTVIYGHNVMSSGESSMFHDVQTKIAADESFFRSCKIYIYTMDGVFVYKPVSVYDTVADYLYFRTGFAGEQEFLSFADEMVSNSHYFSGEKFHSGDTMLTLSTCTNGATDGRYALHAKLIEVVK